MNKKTTTNKKTTPKQIFKQVFVILSGGAFVIFSVAGILRMGTSETQSTTPEQEELSAAQQLQEQAKGYELVLAKEPDNPFAIQNLLSIYLQLGDLNAALPLAEKLVALQPENTRYQETLALIQAGIEAQKNPTPPNPEQPTPQE